MNLEMIECPSCGNDFPKKRMELGYKVCINCSSVKKVVGITTVEGQGDHTYNDLIILDHDTAVEYARREAEMRGQKSDVELFEFDNENEISSSIKKKAGEFPDIDEISNLSILDQYQEDYDN